MVWPFSRKDKKKSAHFGEFEDEHSIRSSPRFSSAKPSPKSSAPASPKPSPHHESHWHHHHAASDSTHNAPGSRRRRVSITSEDSPRRRGRSAARRPWYRSSRYRSESRHDNNRRSESPPCGSRSPSISGGSPRSHTPSRRVVFTEEGRRADGGHYNRNLRVTTEGDHQKHGYVDESPSFSPSAPDASQIAVYGKPQSSGAASVDANVARGTMSINCDDGQTMHMTRDGHMCLDRADGSTISIDRHGLSLKARQGPPLRITSGEALQLKSGNINISKAASWDDHLHNRCCQHDTCNNNTTCCSHNIPSCCSPSYNHACGHGKSVLCGFDHCCNKASTCNKTHICNASHCNVMPVRAMPMMQPVPVMMLQQPAPTFNMMTAPRFVSTEFM